MRAPDWFPNLRRLPVDEPIDQDDGAPAHDDLDLFLVDPVDSTSVHPFQAVEEGEPAVDDWLDADLAGFLPEDDALQEIAEQTAYGEILLEELIRRQRRLAISVSAVFIVTLFGLPLMNLFFADLVALRILGVPVSWLALSVLIYPFLWALAFYFVSTSRKYEDEFTKAVK